MSSPKYFLNLEPPSDSSENYFYLKISVILDIRSGFGQYLFLAETTYISLLNASFLSRFLSTRFKARSSGDSGKNFLVVLAIKPAPLLQAK